MKKYKFKKKSESSKIHNCRICGSELTSDNQYGLCADCRRENASTLRNLFTTLLGLLVVAVSPIGKGFLGKIIKK
jgi:ribosomal protein S14